MSKKTGAKIVQKIIKASTFIKDVASRSREKLPKDTISKAISKYESYTGIQEIRRLQKIVISTQEKFVTSQERRRMAGEKLMEHQLRLKNIHDEMQTMSKSDPNYLKLITEEHKIIVEEEGLRNEFANIEKLEREYFTEMTGAVKLSHETERFYTEKNKYLYIVVSIVGTILGVIGSSINNKIKMKQFKEMLLEEKSGSKLFNLKLGENSSSKLSDLESRVAAISVNQKTILDYMMKTEEMIDAQFKSIKQLLQSKMQKEKIDKTEYSLSNQENMENIKNYCYYGLIGILSIYFISKFT